MEPRTSPSPRRGKRNIFCPYYSDCLNTVIKKCWRQWNCAKCENRTNREAEPEIPLNVDYSRAYCKLALKD